jgi:hypothetical protein
MVKKMNNSFFGSTSINEPMSIEECEKRFIKKERYENCIEEFFNKYSVNIKPTEIKKFSKGDYHLFYSRDEL